MEKVDAAFEAEIASDVKRKPPKDKLEFVRNQIRAMRDLDQDISDAEEKVKTLKRQRMEMEMVTLPDLFSQLNLTHIGLAAEGNQPPYEAKLKDYYHANIQAKWTEERREEALAWVENKGLGDTIKSVINIEFGLGTETQRETLIKVLKKNGVHFTEHRTVPWNTLTSALREMYQRGETLSDKELQTIGATVGKQVKLTPKKEA